MKTPGYIIGKISPEHFIPEHTFVFVIKGIIQVYDGSQTHIFQSGSGALARKNRFARYKKEKENKELDKIFIFLDEAFLKTFRQRYKPELTRYTNTDTLINIPTTGRISSFILSMKPYYQGGGKIDVQFADIKREELLLILLDEIPGIAGLLFDFGKPEKINLEAFMNRNYRFNVSTERLAYLTGRSLSAFKRDFHEIFNESPGRWLIQRRLQEAYFLLDQKNEKPSEIYFELGFETFSHFSFAFKKKFGITPTDLQRRK